MIQVDKSAAEAEVTGRQPDVDAIRQEIEAVAEALRQGSKRNKGRKDAALPYRSQSTTPHRPPLWTSRERPFVKSQIFS